MSSPAGPVTGQCLCGGVRYAVTGPIVRMGHCHCSMCRKAHGAAFGTYAKLAYRHFELRAGAELIERYASSPGVERSFCRRCGSTLQFLQADDREYFGLAAGTLDGDPDVRPSYQIYTDSGAPWYEPDPALWSHPTKPARE